MRAQSLCAGVCCPLFVAAMFVSLHSYWGATQVSMPLGQSIYRITGDEAGIYLASFPKSSPRSAPAIPRTYDFSGRVQFFHWASRAGGADAHLLHIPYWFLWALLTPPILGWLLQKKRRRLRASRRLNHLCLACGYDLRATPTRCRNADILVCRLSRSN